MKYSNDTQGYGEEGELLPKKGRGPIKKGGIINFYEKEFGRCKAGGSENDEIR